MNLTYEERTCRVNGMDMHVVIAGEGPPVLLVHGFPDTHQVWRKQIPALVEAGYRVIAPDTRGCGDSSLSPRVADYRLDNLVADLVGLLDVLEIDQVRLVAHDWGAMQAWHLVLQQPQRVERFIVLSVGHPTAYGNGGLVQKFKGYYILLMQLRGLMEWLSTCANWFLFRQMTHFPAEFPHWQAQLSKPGRLTAGMNYYRANPGMILPREWPSARVPVFGVWSSGDRFLAEGQMIASERYVRGPWRYARIDGANHWLQLDAAEKFNPLLLDYLATPKESL
ncbi:alpha/beta fold hydrolase [Pseudomonas sp. N040]|uniref:alpha/beta fold hydrolase n=1 Tax=Pseudomonas sp. N040 TaxID=2785325 RepID=UPI001C6143CE|nr:alpha/beta fold hydrolase [Pseudomonas sp. N040]MBW7012161.1 alpha/beta fold hydrolase [Pseudomonas sp. N040]